jgi:glycosyltransferase involved in cell wall biosynthesis
VHFAAPAPVQPLTPASVPASTPTISVIVAAYEVADVIADALESIRRQTVAPLEVIVCNDGSTDDLEVALEPYRREIVVLHQENGGEASAKNAAVRKATGDFVLILDADDVFLPERIAALTDVARERPDLDILTTDGLLTAGGRTVRRVYDRSWSFEVHVQRRAILQRNFIFGLATVRRTVLLDHGDFDESIRWKTDWDLWLRLVLAGSSASCVTEPLALYRLRENKFDRPTTGAAAWEIGNTRESPKQHDLRSDELPILESSIEFYRRELAVLDLRSSIAAGSRDARRRALDVVVGRAYHPRVRLEAAAMAAAPTVAGRILHGVPHRHGSARPGFASANDRARRRRTWR